MNIKRISKFIFIFNLLIFNTFNPLFARKIYDIFSGDFIETELYSKDIFPKVKYFRTKVDLAYFHITNPKTEGDKLINERIEGFCIDYLYNDAKALEVLAEWQLRAKVIEELAYSTAYSSGSKNIAMPYLTLIECDAISILNNEITFRLDFQFNLGQYEEDLNIFYYFKANRLTGQINQVYNQLSNSDLNKIQERLSLDINDSYLLVTSKVSIEEMTLIEKSNDDYDMYGVDEEEEKKEKCEDICTQIDFSEARFFWFGWGIVVEFQKFTNSSKIYYGNAFSYFIPIEEAKVIFHDIPGFEFLSKLKPISTSISGFSTVEIFQQLGNFRQQPNIEQLIKRSSENVKRKQLNVNRFQVSADGKKRFMGKTVLDFDRNGRIIKRSNYQDDSSLYNFYTYKYNQSGQLIEEQYFRRYDEESTTLYRYDKRNNLESVQRMEDDDLSELVYFYIENTVYAMNVGAFQTFSPEQIERYSLNSNSVCFNDICYFINFDWKVVGIVSEKYTMYNGQIGYDSTGQIVEYHTDNERYHYYWNYDESGRLIKWYFVDNVKISRETILEYLEGAALPYRMTDNQLSYGNNTVIVEEYQWDNM